MANGFSVSETIDRPVETVWAQLTDFDRADPWMTSVDNLAKTTDGSIAAGTRLTFRSRGQERETVVTAWEPGRRLELTSTQGGVTANYDYVLEPTDDGTRITLDARCRATGPWRLIHPLIVFAMKRSDGDQLAKLRRVVESALA